MSEPKSINAPPDKDHDPETKTEIARLQLTNTPQGQPQESSGSLFAIGKRIAFRHGKAKTSGIIYDVGPTMYCVTAWFGRNPVNLGIDHDDAWLPSTSRRDRTRRNR